MGALMLQMLFYGLAAAVAAPAAAVVAALILARSKRPQLSVWTFTAGAAFLDVIFAAVVLVALSEGSAAGDVGAYIDVGLGVIFSALGVLAIFSKDSPEKDALMRARADRIASGRLPMLIAAGIIVQVINFDAIAVFGGGLKEVVAADVTSAQAVIAVAFGLLLMLIPYYGPAVLVLVSPTRARDLLGQMVEWILANSRILEIVTCAILGPVFLIKGLQVLL
jgi:Sap, sulfolipid-1-addressing protein